MSETLSMTKWMVMGFMSTEKALFMKVNSIIIRRMDTE